MEKMIGQEELSNRFNYAIKQADLEHLTQTRLAELLDSSQALIQRLKAGSGGLSITMAMRVAELTGVTFEWMLTGREPMVVTLISDGALTKGVRKKDIVHLEALAESLRSVND